MTQFQLKTHDGRSFAVTDVQAEAIHNLLNQGSISIKVNHPGGVFYLARGNYKGIDEYKDPTRHLAIGPPKVPEISDAQRSENLKRLAQMKRDFLAKKAIGARP